MSTHNQSLKVDLKLVDKPAKSISKSIYCPTLDVLVAIGRYIDGVQLFVLAVKFKVIVDVLPHESEPNAIPLAILLLLISYAVVFAVDVELGI